MNASNSYFNPSYLNQSTTTKQATPYYDPFNINGLILNILADRTLSRGASDVLAELVRLSGIKGYCYPSIQYLSVTINKGRTQVKVYLKELVTKKRLRIVSYIGRVSAYQLLDILSKKGGPGRFFAHRKEYKNKENVTEKTNVILNFPDKDNHPIVHSKVEATKQAVEEPSPTLAADNNINITTPANNTGPAIQKPILHQQQKTTKTPSNVIDMSLVQEILQVTNDKKSLNCFIKIVKSVHKNIIYTAISSLKIAMDESYISRPGAYFVKTIKNYYPDVFTSPKICSERPLTKNKPIVTPSGTSKKQCFEPEDNVVPASPEVALEAINAIKLMLSKPQRSIPRS